jgi:RNA polymerase sigma factor (sigma-70 family)
MQDFISKFRQGDNEALKYIFDRYYCFLCHSAHKIVRSLEDEKDIVSNSFVQLWEQKDTFNSEEEIVRFLYMKVKLDSLIFLEERKDEKELQADLEYLSANDEFWLERELIEAEVLRILESMIDEMPQIRRQTFNLYRDHSMEITTDLINVKAKTVRNTISQAIKILRDALKKRGLISIIVLLVAIGILIYFIC